MLAYRKEAAYFSIAASPAKTARSGSDALEGLAAHGKERRLGDDALVSQVDCALLIP